MAKIIKKKIETIFGLPTSIRMTFSYFDLLAIKDCIELCNKNKLFKSLMLENYASDVLIKIKKKVNPKDSIE